MNREPTPIDEFSGMPLPISPEYLEERPNSFFYMGNDHHIWHRDGDEDSRNWALGDRALRASRVQVVPYGVHMRYHDVCSGPQFPLDDDERAWATIGAVVGYVPDRAMVFRKLDRVDLVRLSRDTRERMWAMGQIRVDSIYSVREFLCGYLLNREGLDIQESMIDEFLHTRDEAWRLRLGNGLLRRIARYAMEPLDRLYSIAYKAEVIYPPKRAQTAAKFVTRALLHPEYCTRAHERLRDRLVKAA